MPEWLVERNRSFLQHDNSTAEMFMRGMELGLNQKLRNQQMQIQQRTALMEFQKDQAQKERFLLDSREKMLELDDMVAIRNAQSEYVGGNRNINPSLSTYTGNKVWQTWKSGFDLEATETEELNAFNQAVAKLDGYGAASVRSIGPWEKGGILPEHYNALGAAQKIQREELLKSKSETRIIEEGGNRYLQNIATGSIHPIPRDFTQGSPVIPLTDEEGRVLGHGVMNSRGGITQLRQPAAAKRHALQSTLDRAEADLAAAKVDPTRKIELPGLLEKVKSLKKSIGEDEQQPSAVAPSRGNILRYDPVTDTLK